MPIQVSCKCGQTFAAKDNLAGKVVKCPKCAQPLRIPNPRAKAPAAATAPASATLADLLDEAGLKEAHHDEYQGRHCPTCNAPLAHNAILCVECGLNLESGKFVKGAVAFEARQLGKKAEGHEGAAELLLNKAQNALKEEQVELVRNRTEGMPLWLLISLLTIIATLAITMSLMSSRSQAMTISGWVCLTTCSIFSLLFSMRIVIVAFKEDLVVGLLYLFVPFYSLYYIFTRWQKCGRLFLLSLGAGLLAMIGVGMLAIAPHLSDGTEEEANAARRAPVQTLMRSASADEIQPPGPAIPRSSLAERTLRT